MPAHLVEILPPDLSAYKKGRCLTHIGLEGDDIDYVHQFESGRDGPHVVITALVHGNEYCGAIALDHLLKQKIRPLRGCLTLIFANIVAFDQFAETSPFANRYADEDFNRIWSKDILDDDILENHHHSQELTRARQIQPIIDQADYLLDLHSMGEICPPLVLCGGQPRGLHLAKKMGLAPYIISDEGHHSGRRLRDYEPFITPDGLRNSLLVECGQHWQQSSADFAIEYCYRFLENLGLIENTAPARKNDSPKHLQVTDVITVKSQAFFFQEPVQPMDIIKTAGTILGHDGDQPILTPYDDCYLIMPQHGARTGQTAARLAKTVRDD